MPRQRLCLSDSMNISSISASRRPPGGPMCCCTSTTSDLQKSALSKTGSSEDFVSWWKCRVGFYGWQLFFFLRCIKDESGGPCVEASKRLSCCHAWSLCLFYLVLGLSCNADLISHHWAARAMHAPYPWDGGWSHVFSVRSINELQLSTMTMTRLDSLKYLYKETVQITRIHQQNEGNRQRPPTAACQQQ